MAIGRVVPWSSWGEWDAVYRGLFADDALHRQAAVQQLALWRCRGKVPLAIDITGCLTEIIIRDQDLTVSSSASDGVMRLEYSMAIVRMVNGISDKAQKGKTATSVSSNAAAAGLPRLLVDVRHEASHNDMPSLSLLRLAAAQALDWLQAAYWQRQAAHLHQQQHRVIHLLKEYVAAKAGSQLNLDSAQGDQVTSPGTSSGSAGRGKRQAASARAEEMHEQQALLNQLKEVPVKGMNASLLVAPLLDHGLLESHTSEGTQDTATAGKNSAQLISSEIVQSLAMLWPSLPALLLAGAVQRLCHTTQHLQAHTADLHASTLASWVQALLARHSSQDSHRQQQARTSTRGSKRKSMSSDATAAAPVHAAFVPPAAQLKSCIEDCLAALPRAEAPTAAALRQVLALLIGQVKQSHTSEYALWGSTADKLTNLCRPVTEDEGLPVHGAAAVQQHQGPDAGPSSSDVQQAVDRQQQMLQGMSSEVSAAGRELRGWERVDDWIPCAIGAQPSIADHNGSVPIFNVPQLTSVDQSDAMLGAAVGPHASPMAFAMLSANPGWHAQQPNVEQQEAVVLGVASHGADAKPTESLQEHWPHNSCVDTVYDDYWQRFDDADTVADVSVSAVPIRALVPEGKAVKVL